jgi:hypothetical protein
VLAEALLKVLHPHDAVAREQPIKLFEGVGVLRGWRARRGEPEVSDEGS